MSKVTAGGGSWFPWPSLLITLLLSVSTQPPTVPSLDGKIPRHQKDMIRSMRHLRLAVLAMALTTCLLFHLSCARDQELVSITVQPDTETFGVPDPSLHVQLRALGNYVHPPVTKDITGQVTWASDATQVVTVTTGGLLAPGGGACGNAVVSATVQTNQNGSRTAHGAIVTGMMNANVTCPGSSGSSTLTVSFTGRGAGTVTSSPSGLACANSCTGSFTTGTTVSLTATANIGSIFGGWLGCDTASGPVCNVILNANRVVTVTFN